MTSPDPVVAPPWRDSWRANGSLSLLRNPQIIWLLASGERRDKYRGTWLGGAWEYARPLTRFFMYYVVIGILLGITKRIENFGVYIFSGVVTIQFFASALTNGTRALAKHASMLRRVNIPAAALPVSAVLATLYRQKAPMLVLAIATVLTGWRPNHLDRLPFLVFGVVFLVFFTSGLAMVTSVATMYVKDTQYAVETIVTVSRYGSPVLYSWTLVPQHFGPLITTIYLSNPVTVAMYSIRTALWSPTVGPAAVHTAMPAAPLLPTVLSAVVAVATFMLGLWLQHRTEHRVASRVS